MPEWYRIAVAATEDLSSLAPDYEMVARACGMSLRSLRYHFRKLTGTSLHRFTIEQRMAAARARLGDQGATVKAVAAGLGYDDVFFFSRQFEKYVGVTPAAYRRSRQG
jgi:AraC-like DNA-binding protein